jgi:DNA repair photolyase
MSTFTPHGRGTSSNPPNRFEQLYYDPNDLGANREEWEEEAPGPQTQFLREQSKSVIAHNNSPDIGFASSINPYRGCEHGCVYCYARPTHEYLGFRSGLDFETKIVVKENAPQLLRKELAARSWKPQVVSVSGVTDCYQPIERKLELTRRCLQVLLDFRNPAGIITKNHLITRDIDVLREMASLNLVSVCISVTSLDTDLARRMEPRASAPQRRLAAVEKLALAGVPVGVLVCPIIPGLTDTEMPAILQAARDAGAQFAGYNIIALPWSNKELFDSWLLANYPEKYAKVMSKIRQIRGGKLYDADFGQRMTGQGILAEQIGTLFKLAKRKAGFPSRGPRLTTEHFRIPAEGQLELF